MVKKIISIKKRRDFLDLREIGKKISTKFFIVYFKKNINENINLGITVSKKHGNAVKRNYLRRVIRAIFIKNVNEIPDKLKIEMIPKKKDIKSSFKQLEEDFLGIFNNLR